MNYKEFENKIAMFIILLHGVSDYRGGIIVKKLKFSEMISMSFFPSIDGHAESEGFEQ